MRFLVVEDDFLVAEALADALEERGHEVIGPAASIDSAEALMRRHGADGAVLDVALRDADAHDLAASLHRAGVPFVVYSGRARERLQGELQRAEYIAKPARPARVADAVERVTRSSSTVRLNLGCD